MSFESALREELQTISGLSGKIFPINAPEQTLAPYIAYLSSEGTFDKTLTGFLNTREVACELNIIGATYPEMKSLEQQVLTKLKTFPLRTIGTSNVYIQEIILQEPVEMYEAELRMYRCNIEFTITY